MPLMSEKPRILFVDDEPLLLEALQRAYFRHKRAEWDMFFENSPQKAIELQKAYPFHVVVTDFHMPDINGLELAKSIQASDDSTQIVMLTGAADLDTAVNAINSTRIYRFYTKPCEPEVLEQGIEDCLLRHSQKTQSLNPPAQAGYDILNRLPIGVIVCDTNTHVIHMNQFAAEICATRQVFSIDPTTNKLRASLASYRDELKACIQSVAPQDRAMSLSRKGSDTSVCVIISNLKEGQNDRVMLLISDPDRHMAPSIDILQSIYDLPPSEARLLQHIVQGYSLLESADKMGITESSARTYLKRIFSKTNTRGQPELIRSVLLTPTLHQQENRLFN